VAVLSQIIPNLFNGVSQQPPALRSPTQAELQENAESSLVTGLSKRKPTRHIAQISNFSYTNALVHLIESGAERFIAFFDGVTVTIFNADTGVAASISKPSGEAYIVSSNPRDLLRCVTVADYTFVLNRAKAVGAVGHSATTITGTVQTFANLPAATGTNNVYRINGTPDNAFASYYVRDQAAGVWAETVAYDGSGTGPLTSDMPWTLTRTGANSFAFQPASWATRVVGDQTTNPNPSFVGRAITDVFFYRDRLGLITDSTIIMSRAGDYFNFFPRTMTAVLDDDPIDATVAHPKAVYLSHAVPFNSNLLIFGNRVQFQLTGGDVLSPRTVRIDPIIEMDCSAAAKPVGIGPSVYFAQPGLSNTLVREMFVRPDSLQNDAEDVTAHVPLYIPSGVFGLAASSVEETLFVASLNDERALYVYKTKWKGDQRIQSSWSRWVFGSAVDGTRILGVVCWNTYVYLVISRGVGTSIERLDLADVSFPIRDGDGTNWIIHLDKRTPNYLSGIYDATNDWTTWTIPYDLNTSVPFQLVVYGVGIDAGSGQWISDTSRPTLTTVRAPGKWDEQFCLGGIPYTFRYRMSPIYKRNDEGAPAISGRLQLRKVDVLCRDTGYLRVEVTPARRSLTSRIYAPMFTGILSTGFSNVETGKVSCAVQSNADTVRLDFVNDTPYPSAIHAVEWSGDYSSRT
jgi:hypothetical protein